MELKNGYRVVTRDGKHYMVVDGFEGSDGTSRILFPIVGTELLPLEWYNEDLQCLCGNWRVPTKDIMIVAKTRSNEAHIPNTPLDILWRRES